MSHHRLHTDASTSAINGTHPASEERPSLRPGRAQTARSWPLLVLALPATVAVWSGWVGIGQMTGFGQVYPLPGIFDSLHLDTAVTLPVGVEAYAAYALRAWLSASAAVSARTRRFARWSAIGSLVLGMAGQVAYHLLAQAGARHAPWAITTAVSCLPVLVLGMGAALAHLLRADQHNPRQPERAEPDLAADHAPPAIQSDMIEAQAAAALLSTSGKRISRRTLRTAGIHGSNTDLGALARIVRSEADLRENAGRPRHPGGATSYTRDIGMNSSGVPDARPNRPTAGAPSRTDAGRDEPVGGVARGDGREPGPGSQADVLVQQRRGVEPGAQDRGAGQDHQQPGPGMSVPPHGADDDAARGQDDEQADPVPGAGERA
jgi:hypothetical protein